MIGVACRTEGCPARDAVRRLRLRPAALGFVERPNLLCVSCGASPEIVSGWPFDAAAGATQEQEEGDEMAKITVHGGPSNAAADPPVGERGPELVDLPPGSTVHETSSAGAHSPADDTTPDPTVADPVVAESIPAAFDPADHTVTAVVEHLVAAAADGDKAEVDRVLAAERAGKQRRGILTFTG